MYNNLNFKSILIDIKTNWTTLWYYDFPFQWLPFSLLCYVVVFQRYSRHFMDGLEKQKVWIQILALPLVDYITLYWLVNLFEPLILHLYRKQYCFISHDCGKNSVVYIVKIAMYCHWKMLFLSCLMSSLSTHYL